jgi:hypothetical protein
MSECPGRRISPVEIGDRYDRGRMNVTRLLSALALLSLIGLVLTIPASSSPGQTPALSVKIAAPADGAILRGPARFSVRYRGVRPQRVDFYLNGGLRHVDRQPPFVYKAGRVALSELRPGRNTLRVIARRGGARAAHRITVSVAQPAAGLNLSRIPWEGGPVYWSQFAKANAAGWDEPKFFPIAVFLGQPSHASTFVSAGINTFMAVDHVPPISQATRKGMFVIAQYPVSEDRSGWTESEIGNDPKVVGWFLGDECEMGYCGGKDERDYLRIVKERAANRRALNDGRFIFTNFGNGVLGTFWSPNTMADMMREVDAASVDKYAYTNPQVRFEYGRAPAWGGSEAAAGTSAAYGWLADRLRFYDNPNDRRPQWVFVETKQPMVDRGGRVIALHEIEGAVWSAIAHEARGIAYFQHNNAAPPECTELYSIVECGQALRNKLAAINAKIRSLAPVLNTQSYRYNFNSGTDTMLKTYNGYAYIFASIGVKQTPGTKTFRLPAGVNGTRVLVEREGRTLPVVNGRFTDEFANEYSHHVYRIPLGAR